MIIISFDIGINNFSFVVMETEDTNFKINTWDNVRIKNIEPPLLCCEKNKKNKNQTCGKTARYYVNLENKETYCGIHKKGKENIQKIVVKKKKDKFNLLEINLLLIEKLDSLKLGQIDYVLIEQQPIANQRMKNISLCLFNYFSIRGITDKVENKIKDILFISPKNKLKCYDGPVVEIKSKNQYTKRKKLAIEYCKYFLKDFEKDLEFFNSLKKKDDAADCFLQGLWFLKNRKFIN
jgi:hypothetical protein